MKTATKALLTLIGLAAGAQFAPRLCAAADLVSDMPPPAARLERAPSPRDGFVWGAGHWELSGHNYVWVSGTWIAERRGAHWIADHWDQDGSHWRFVPGHWQR
jgi:WXXGXW repeat (2 copies)